MATNRALRMGTLNHHVEQRCYRLGINPAMHKKSNNKELAYKIIREYWVKTITLIARKHRLEERQIRHIMMKWSNDYCTENKVPMITKLRHLKIANEIVNDKKLRRNAKMLAQLTGISLLCVEEYLNG